MGLSEQDKEWVKLISAEIAERVTEKVILTHIVGCPYGKMMAASKAFMIGVCIGSGLAGGGLAVGITKLFGV